MNFRSSYLAKTRTNTLNVETRAKAAVYYLEVTILQYNNRVFNYEKMYIELINYKLFVDLLSHFLKEKLLLSI